MILIYLPVKKIIKKKGKERNDFRRHLFLFYRLFTLLFHPIYAGAVELGSAGVSVSIFNIISKLFNIPLLSVATSFVAEDLSKHTSKDSKSGQLIITLHTFVMAFLLHTVFLSW